MSLLLIRFLKMCLMGGNTVLRVCYNYKMHLLKVFRTKRPMSHGVILRF